MLCESSSIQLSVCLTCSCGCWGVALSFLTKCIVYSSRIWNVSTVGAIFDRRLICCAGNNLAKESEISELRTQVSSWRICCSSFLWYQSCHDGFCWQSACAFVTTTFFYSETLKYWTEIMKAGPVQLSFLLILWSSTNWTLCIFSSFAHMKNIYYYPKNRLVVFLVRWPLTWRKPNH